MVARNSNRGYDGRGTRTSSPGSASSLKRYAYASLVLADPGDEVARIGQQLKKVRIRFAGAGSEQDLVRRDRVTRLRVVAAHDFARRQRSGRLRIVPQRARVGQRCHDLLGIRKARVGGVRFGQVQKLNARAALLPEETGQAVGGEVPVK